jgi:DNA-binding PucR family transcriptional regulator
VADLDDTQMRSLLLRLADLVLSPELLMAGKLGALRQHDEQHHTSYVESLATYLDCFGDVSAAAQSLHIHANTLRYRVNKLQEISGIDLSDPAERLDLLLQQQLLRILKDR